MVDEQREEEQQHQHQQQMGDESNLGKIKDCSGYCHTYKISWNKVDPNLSISATVMHPDGKMKKNLIALNAPGSPLGENTPHLCYYCDCCDPPVLLVENHSKKHRKPYMTMAFGKHVKEHKPHERKAAYLRKLAEKQQQQQQVSAVVEAQQQQQATGKNKIITERDVTELQSKYEELEKRFNLMEEINKRIMSALKGTLDAFAGILVD